MPVTRKTSKGLANGVRSSAKHKLAPAYREKQGGKVKAPSLRSVPKKPSDRYIQKSHGTSAFESTAVEEKTIPAYLQAFIGSIDDATAARLQDEVRKSRDEWNG